MSPTLASLIYSAFILGLFILNWDRKDRTSIGLWLPVFWLLIAGSRSLSAWLDTQAAISAAQVEEGSPVDRMVYLGLLLAGIVVLLARWRKVALFLRQNAVLVVFVLYCAISITWSDYPDVAFKRWIKSLGDYVMVLIVLTDAYPLNAVKRLVTRVSFALVPLSILLIKYFPNLGRAYSPWNGAPEYAGVAVTKNMLGRSCLILGLGIVWSIGEELRAPRNARRIRTLIALVVVLAMTAWLFWMANSMTSLSCFLMGTILIVAMSLSRNGQRTWLVQILLLVMVSISVSALFFESGSALVEKLGRDPTLTGRTELWKQVIRLSPNPIIGSGFESFWLGQRLERLWAAHWWHPNEAHDGYLETYLNLGWIGVALLGVILINGYRRVIRLLKQEPPLGRICLTFFFVGVVYNLTEAGIRSTDLAWIAFVFALICIPQVAPAREEIFAETEPLPRSHESPAEMKPARAALQSIASTHRSVSRVTASGGRVVLPGNHS